MTVISWRIYSWKRKMGKQILDISEIKDSKLLYDKDMPPFGYALIVVVLALMVTVAFWGTVNTKPYIVKGTGVVESSNKNYVMTPFTGSISQVEVSEGDYVESGDVLFVVKSTDIDIQNKQIENQKKIYEKQVNQNAKLVKSIKDNKNYFSPSKAADSLYYSQYEEYKAQVRQQVVDVKALKEYGYSEEQIKEEQKKNDDKKAEIYHNAINRAEEAKKQAQTQLDLLNAQADAVSKGEEDYKVKATATGVVHMLGEYKDGAVVQTATPVASISTENDEYYVKAQISAADRSRIKEGNKAEIEVSGLQQNIYGTIKRKVVQIDSDVSVTEKGTGYFNIKVLPEKKYLISKEGNKVNLSSGLNTEVRIVYKEITYAAYILDALGVKD